MTELTTAERELTELADFREKIERELTELCKRTNALDPEKALILGQRTVDALKTKAEPGDVRLRETGMFSMRVDDENVLDPFKAEYKRVGLLGTETLQIHSCYMGKRVGLLMCFTCDSVPGWVRTDVIIEMPMNYAWANVDVGESSLGDFVKENVLAKVKDFDTIVEDDVREKAEREKALLEEEAKEKVRDYGDNYGMWG